MFTSGKRVTGPLARLAAAPGIGLVGIATSKKIGNTPVRNRTKRRFSEAIRLERRLVEDRLDYILIVSLAGAGASFLEIQSEIESLFVKMKERWAGELESS